MAVSISAIPLNTTTPAPTSAVVPIVVNGITRKTFLGNITDLCGGGTLTSLTAGTNVSVTSTQVSLNTSELTVDFVLPGIVVPYVLNSDSPPTGWLFCNGASYATSMFPNLFAAIGYSFGGSGSSFNVPDLRGRIPFTAGSSTSSPLNGATFSSGNYQTVGATGGFENISLTSSQAPIRNHTHTPVGSLTMRVYGRNDASAFDGECSPPGSYTDYNFPGTVAGNGTEKPLAKYNVSSSTSSFTPASSQPHNNMPPCIVMTYLIKT